MYKPLAAQKKFTKLYFCLKTTYTLLLTLFMYTSFSVICPPGFQYVDFRGKNCRECYRGYYKNTTGNTNCVKCPGVTYTADGGATTISNCSLGMFR